MCHFLTCTRRVGRYSEPRQRPDGFFVKGNHLFKVHLNIWRIIGAVRGEAGMPNESFQKPICEHVKNLLRGRAAWGVKHQLSAVWAQLPAGQLQLAQPFPTAPKKRSRAGLPKPVAMQML